RKVCVWGKLDSGRSCRGGAQNDDIWRGGRTRVARLERRNCVLGCSHCGIANGVEDRGIDDAAVKNAVTTAENVLSAAGDVPSEAEPRTEIRAVGRKHVGGGEIGSRNLRRRHDFRFAAQTENEGKEWF